MEPYLQKLWQHRVPDSVLRLYFRPILYIIFRTQKLDATAKNRFQILILHLKKHVFRKKLFLVPIY